ncbi:MAG: hypothetical protein H6492_00580 [Candidatus Paracaedibacteraceae bacterium]|nr:hypothetical protein [Candidatus Paracaedibacteraceae bacterium]
MAREMLAGDEALDKVMRYTKLSREEIEALQRGEQLPIEKELDAEMLPAPSGSDQ